MKAYELYTAVDPAQVTSMLDWFRANDREVYKTAIATLAQTRKLRPVFIQKKSLADQYAWIHKTLQSKAGNSIGEHLLQAYLMAGQQPLLAAFCDAMSIPHDGKGSVIGSLPKELDAARLDTAVDRLLESHHPQLVAIYLHCFNMQQIDGWPVLTAKLASDERLKLG